MVDDASDQNAELVLKEVVLQTGPLAFNSGYAIVMSIVTWTALYRIWRYLLPTKSREFCDRILSFLHGFVTAFVGINQCFVVDIPFDHPEWRTTHSQRFLLVCSLGYFVFDLAWLILYDTSSKLMLAHHVYSILATYRMLYKEKSGAQATCALGCMEISNPLLQSRWFLRSEGFYPSNLFASVEITFLVVFFLVRILLGTYFLYVISFQPKNDWDFRILAATIYLMSWIFMFNITKYVIKKYNLGVPNPELHNKGT